MRRGIERKFTKRTHLVMYKRGRIVTQTTPPLSFFPIHHSENAHCRLPTDSPRHSKKTQSMNISHILTGYRVCTRTALLALLFSVLPQIALQAAKPALIDSVNVSVGTVVSSKHDLPFWLWANQDGRVPQVGNSSFTRLRLGRKADDEKELDWMYGVDVTMRSNSAEPATRWTDAWGGLVYKNLQLTFGRKSEIFGLADSLLTAGPEVNSRNAPTIPKIAISTRGYFQLTDMLGVNAYFAHGWFGTDPYSSGPFLHEKFVYFRFGDTWPDDGINFYAGIHDNCVWGGKDQPSSFTDYLRVVSGRQGGSNAAWYDKANALGDHKGTLETALQFKGADRDWYLYGMTMFEETGGFRLFQPGDWFVGASLTFKDPDSRVQRLNVECIDTRKQSSGANTETRFYGNYGGWVHDGYGIGMPFIPFVQGPGNTWYPLNLIKAFSGAVLTRFSPMLNPLFRISWVQVYGSDAIDISQIPPGKLAKTLSLSLANTMHINRTWSLSQQFSADFSKNTTPAIGAFFSISKTWR